MASIIWKFSHDIIESKYCSIFTKREIRIGSQARDFVYVQDVCRIIEYLIKYPKNYGIINFGTGISTEFDSIALKIFEFAQIPKNIKYIDMPADFIRHYQWHTRSDTVKFYKFFPNFEFTSLSSGIQRVLVDLRRINN
jgi:ADP-L-glycero-D-manno-heptose 6-epimerase